MIAFLRAVRNALFMWCAGGSCDMPWCTCRDPKLR